MGHKNNISLDHQKNVTACEICKKMSPKIPNATTIAAMRAVEEGEVVRYSSIQEMFDELDKKTKKSG